MVGRISRIWVLEPPADVAAIIGAAMYFVVLSGTLFQSLTAGVAALVREARPDWDGDRINGKSEVYRVDMGARDGFIIRWTMPGGNSGVWEQTTLNGKLALKTAANKFGWGL